MFAFTIKSVFSNFLKFSQQNITSQYFMFDFNLFIFNSIIRQICYLKQCLRVQVKLMFWNRFAVDLSLQNGS